MYDSEFLSPPDEPLEPERDRDPAPQPDIAELVERVYRLMMQDVRLERARSAETKHQLER